MHFLGILIFMENCISILQKDKGFDNRTFEKQMAVMRGQVLNKL